MWLIPKTGPVCFPEDGLFNTVLEGQEYDIKHKDCTCIDLTGSPSPPKPSSPPTKKPRTQQSHLIAATGPSSSSTSATIDPSQGSSTSEDSSSDSDSTSSIGRIVCTICKERPYGPKACIQCGNIICTTCSNNLMSPICPICRKELKLVRLIL